MKVIVCGGRDFDDQEFAFAALDRFNIKHPVTLVIEGGAKGADALGAQWARLRGIDCWRVEADWDKHGKAAGPIRNKLMLDLQPDAVIAFPGGKGTANMVSQAESQHINIWRPKYLQP